MPATVADLSNALNRIAPVRLAESWDNVGLLVGDPAAAVTRVLLCIDLTADVLAEAVEKGCEAVVAYHPLIFEGLKRFAAGNVAFEAARRDIAVYSPHTALDAAEGGTNDVLAGILGLTEVSPLRQSEGKATTCKLVTFAPHEVADAVAEAMFAAGAGEIGEYRRCSFRSEGEGTFEGSASSKPTVGMAGKFERASEVKIETLVPLANVSAVVAAVRKAHPYEEPAMDLVVLAALPEAGGVGVGRVGKAAAGETLGSLVGRLKRGAGVERLLVAAPFEMGRVVGKVAVCAGAGRSLVGDVIRAGAEVFVTGELPHHEALALRKAGVAAVCTLHSRSERPALAVLAKRLEAELAGRVTTFRSGQDREPFAIV